MGLETALLVSMGASAAGTAMSAYGSYQQGKQEQEIYKANAGLYRQEAESVKEAGRDEASLIKERARELLAKQIVMAAAGGGDLAGSNLNVMADSAFQAERDAQMTLRNADVEAVGLRNRANVAEAYGKSAKKAGNIRAVTGILQGVSNILPLYQSYNALNQNSWMTFGTQAGGAPRLSPSQKTTLATIGRY